MVYIAATLKENKNKKFYGENNIQIYNWGKKYKSDAEYGLEGRCEQRQSKQQLTDLKQAQQ